MNTTKTSSAWNSESGKNVNISPSKVKLDIHKEVHEKEEDESDVESLKHTKKKKKNKKKKQDEEQKLNDLLKIYGYWSHQSFS